MAGGQSRLEAAKAQGSSAAFPALSRGELGWDSATHYGVITGTRALLLGFLTFFDRFPH